MYLSQRVSTSIASCCRVSIIYSNARHPVFGAIRIYGLSPNSKILAILAFLLLFVPQFVIYVSTPIAPYYPTTFTSTDVQCLNRC